MRHIKTYEENDSTIFEYYLIIKTINKGDYYILSILNDYGEQYYGIIKNIFSNGEMRNTKGTLKGYDKKIIDYNTLYKSDNYNNILNELDIYYRSNLYNL